MTEKIKGNQALFKEEPMSPEDIVQKQVEFYNNHDLDGFLSMYDDTIEIYTINCLKPDLQGMSELTVRYSERFKNPNLHVIINNRMTKGNYVIDEEYVEGISESIISVVAIYETQNDKIKKVVFIR
jgi:hypothetical protein